MDAFTAKEYASFHLKVLDDHLPIAVDILGDIVLNPLFDPIEMTKEKKVIFEEINMVEDTPDDLVMELFIAVLLARPSAGPAHPGHEEAASAPSKREQLAAFFRRSTGPRTSWSPPPATSTTRRRRSSCTGTSARWTAGGDRRNGKPPRPRPGRGHPLQEGAGAGPRLPGRARVRAGPPGPLRRLHPQHRPGRQHVVAPLPERAREARARLLDLVRHHRLLGRGHPERLRRARRPRLGGRGDPADGRGAAPAEGRAAARPRSCAARRTT